MSKICRAYDYSTAEESRKPGYLKSKFDRVRRELREKAERQAAVDAETFTKVAPLKRSK